MQHCAATNFLYLRKADLTPGGKQENMLFFNADKPRDQLHMTFAAKARLLANLSNQARLELLSIIVERERSVGDLARELQLSQSALSQHLARLRTDDLVQTRRDAQTIYYRCANEGVQRVLRTLNEIFEPEATTTARLDDDQNGRKAG